jgi:type IV secretion system protein VirB2
MFTKIQDSCSRSHTSGFIRTRGTAFFLLLIPTLAFAHKMDTAHFEPPQAGPKGEAPGTARVTFARSGSVPDWLSLKLNLGFALLGLLLPGLVLAQSSPFQTGATALQSNLLTLLTPVAIILVIGLGVMAMANRIAWGWCIGAISGIAVAFGAPQIVGWIRGMFGV